MRGKQVPHDMPCRALRIIPAHAGQTRRVERAAFLITDHPRACGANNPDCDRVVQDAGSSPRMRGKHFHEVRVFDLGRIIPAHAGQTLPRGPRIRPWSDHPRACGANWVLGQHVNVAPGSSPRMRGKPMTRCSRCSGIRIIPAHAGQTPPPTGWKRGEPDHPRACGANALYVIGTVESSGSSPRMRGKLPREDAKSMPRLDHPRACGANVVESFGEFCGHGSSPRMRGKLSNRNLPTR